MPNKRTASKRQVARLVTLYQSADAEQLETGRHWYDAAQSLARDLATLGNLSPMQGAAILSAASVNQTWSGNITVARRAVEQHALGGFRHVGMHVVDDFVRQILAGNVAPFATQKLTQFALAIAGDSNAVVIDRWMYRAVGESDGQSTAKYARVADAVRQAAAIVGETPRDMQAIIWTVVRDLNT